jgi:magnesium chelatase subunit D
LTEAADSRETGDRASPWDDALLALSLFAVDPAGLAGVRLRSPPGPARTAWLDLLRLALPPAAPVRRVPANIGDPALLGGLDLAATLRAGRPVHAAGLLAACDGGVAVLAMAERMPAATAARLCAVLDGGTIDHGTDRSPCRLGVVALDEGIEADESTAAALLDRLAFDLDLSAVSHRALGGDLPEAGLLAAARRGVARVALSDQVIGALCGAGLALGIGSPRGVLLAARAARAAAALEGREEATMEDEALAARQVLEPRATRLPILPNRNRRTTRRRTGRPRTSRRPTRARSRRRAGRRMPTSCWRRRAPPSRAGCWRGCNRPTCAPDGRVSRGPERGRKGRGAAGRREPARDRRMPRTGWI